MTLVSIKSDIIVRQIYDSLWAMPPRRVMCLAPSFCRKLTGKCWYACHKSCIYSYYSLEKCTEKGRGGCEEEKISWTVQE